MPKTSKLLHLKKNSKNEKYVDIPMKKSETEVQLSL